MTNNYRNSVNLCVVHLLNLYLCVIYIIIVMNCWEVPAKCRISAGKKSRDHGFTVKNMVLQISWIIVLSAGTRRMVPENKSETNYTTKHQQFSKMLCGVSMAE